MIEKNMVWDRCFGVCTDGVRSLVPPQVSILGNLVIKALCIAIIHGNTSSNYSYKKWIQTWINTTIMST
jgi:hypothetical protein